MSPTGEKSNLLLTKYRPYAGIFIFLVSLLLAYSLGDILYRLSQAQDLKIKEEEREIARRKQVIEDVRYIRSQTPDFPNRVKVLDNLVFQGSGIGSSQFLAQIEAISKKTQVSIDSIKPNSEGDKVTAELQVKGTEEAVKNFIISIERNKLTINFQSMTLNYLENGNILATIVVVSGT